MKRDFTRSREAMSLQFAFFCDVTFSVEQVKFCHVKVPRLGKSRSNFGDAELSQKRAGDDVIGHVIVHEVVFFHLTIN